MAFSITCPTCSAKLKTATAIPIGRNVACPKCKSNFAVTVDIMEEVPDTKTVAPASAARAAAPAADVKSTPARKLDDDDDDMPRKKRDDDDAPRSRKNRDDDNDLPKKKNRDDDDDDRPRSRKNRDDDEDDRPKKKGRDDDDDDRPRARKNRDDDDDDRPKKKGRDDDDDDRPRSRKKRDDDDEDDRPKKKGRDDDDDDRPRSRKKRDDDDDDDRPKRKGRGDDEDDDDRPRKKKKKGGKTNIGKLVALGVGGLVIVGGIIFLIMYLMGGGYDKEMVALMPSDTTSMNYTNIEKLLDHPKAKKQIEKEFNDSSKYAIFKTAGMAVGDLKSSLEGSVVKKGGGKNNFGGGDHIEVIRFKKSLDKGKVTSGGTESKAGSKSYWKLKDGAYISFPADDLVVLCGSEDTIKTILNKEDGKVVISETLQTLAKKVGGGDVWFANAREGDGGGNMDFPGMDEAMKIRMKAKGSASRIEISGNSVSSTSYTLCDSEESAAKLLEDDKKKWEEGKSKIEERFADKTKFGGKAYTDAQKEALKKAYMGADFSKSGAIVESTRTIDTTPFTDDDGPGGFFF